MPPLQGPYGPYDVVPVPPPDPLPDRTRPRVFITGPNELELVHGPFDVVVEFSQAVTGFEQSEFKTKGAPHRVTAWEEEIAGERFVATITPTFAEGGDIIFNVDANVAQDAGGNWNLAATELTVTVPQEHFNFTGLPADVPLPTFPYPQTTTIPDPYHLPEGETAPVPPDYAVPVLARDTPPEPALTVQAYREFSPLEKRIAEVVFGQSPSFSEAAFENVLEIKYEAELPNGWNASHGSDGTGKIKISNAKFPYTPALNGDTAVSDLTTAQLNSPGMLAFIFTFAHEMAHYWQSDQNRHLWPRWRSGYKEPHDIYRFNEAQLTVNKFVDKEAQASAVATYAVIEWQLKNRPEGQMINLTTSVRRFPREDCGSLERYMKIRGMPVQGSGRNITTSPPAGVWITKEEAVRLQQDFQLVATEIKTASPLPEPADE